jgi:hypothetical protein
MRVSHAASGFAIALGALLIVPQVFSHRSFAPHFDSSKPVNISGRSRNSRHAIATVIFTSLRPTRTDTPASMCASRTASRSCRAMGSNQRC